MQCFGCVRYVLKLKDNVFGCGSCSRNRPRSVTEPSISADFDSVVILNNGILCSSQSVYSSSSAGRCSPSGAAVALSYHIDRISYAVDQDLSEICGRDLQIRRKHPGDQKMSRNGFCLNAYLISTGESMSSASECNPDLGSTSATGGLANHESDQSTAPSSQDPPCDVRPIIADSMLDPDLDDLDDDLFLRSVLDGDSMLSNIDEIMNKFLHQKIPENQAQSSDDQSRLKEEEEQQQQQQQRHQDLSDVCFDLNDTTDIDEFIARNTIPLPPPTSPPTCSPSLFPPPPPPPPPPSNHLSPHLQDSSPSRLIDRTSSVFESTFSEQQQQQQRTQQKEQQPDEQSQQQQTTVGDPTYSVNGLSRSSFGINDDITRDGKSSFEINDVIRRRDVKAHASKFEIRSDSFKSSIPQRPTQPPPAPPPAPPPIPPTNIGNIEYPSLGGSTFHSNSANTFTKRCSGGASSLPCSPLLARSSGARRAIQAVVALQQQNVKDESYVGGGALTAGGGVKFCGAREGIEGVGIGLALQGSVRREDVGINGNKLESDSIDRLGINGTDPVSPGLNGVTGTDSARMTTDGVICPSVEQIKTTLLATNREQSICNFATMKTHDHINMAVLKAIGCTAVSKINQKHDDNAVSSAYTATSSHRTTPPRVTSNGDVQCDGDTRQNVTSLPPRPPQRVGSIKEMRTSNLSTASSVSSTSSSSSPGSVSSRIKPIFSADDHDSRPTLTQGIPSRVDTVAESIRVPYYISGCATLNRRRPSPPVSATNISNIMTLPRSGIMTSPRSNIPGTMTSPRSNIPLGLQKPTAQIRPNAIRSLSASAKFSQSTQCLIARYRPQDAVHDTGYLQGTGEDGNSCPQETDPEMCGNFDFNAVTLNRRSSARNKLTSSSTNLSKLGTLKSKIKDYMSISSTTIAASSTSNKKQQQQQQQVVVQQPKRNFNSFGYCATMPRNGVGNWRCKATEVTQAWAPHQTDYNNENTDEQQTELTSPVLTSPVESVMSLTSTATSSSGHDSFNTYLNFASPTPFSARGRSSTAAPLHYGTLPNRKLRSSSLTSGGGIREEGEAAPQRTFQTFLGEQCRSVTKNSVNSTVNSDVNSSRVLVEPRVTIVSLNKSGFELHKDDTSSHHPRQGDAVDRVPSMMTLRSPTTRKTTKTSRLTTATSALELRTTPTTTTTVTSKTTTKMLTPSRLVHSRTQPVTMTTFRTSGSIRFQTTVAPNGTVIANTTPATGMTENNEKDEMLESCKDNISKSIGNISKDLVGGGGCNGRNIPMYKSAVSNITRQQQQQQQQQEQQIQQQHLRENGSGSKCRSSSGHHSNRYGRPVTHLATSPAVEDMMSEINEKILTGRNDEHIGTTKASNGPKINGVKTNADVSIVKGFGISEAGLQSVKLNRVKPNKIDLNEINPTNIETVTNGPNGFKSCKAEINTVSLKGSKSIGVELNASKSIGFDLNGTSKVGSDDELSLNDSKSEGMNSYDAVFDIVDRRLEMLMASLQNTFINNSDEFTSNGHRSSSVPPLSQPTSGRPIERSGGGGGSKEIDGGDGNEGSGKSGGKNIYQGRDGRDGKDGNREVGQDERGESDVSYSYCRASRAGDACQGGGGGVDGRSGGIKDFCRGDDETGNGNVGGSSCLRLNGVCDGIRNVSGGGSRGVNSRTDLALLTRRFVADSQSVVSSATQSRDRLATSVGASVDNLSDIVAECRATAGLMVGEGALPSPPAVILVNRVKDLVGAYGATVNASRGALGKSFGSVEMKLLMKHATSLAAVLTSLVKLLNRYDYSC